MKDSLRNRFTYLAFLSFCLLIFLFSYSDNLTAKTLSTSSFLHQQSTKTPWGANLVNCPAGNFRLSQPTSINTNEPPIQEFFLRLFNKHRQKTVQSFQWLVNQTSVEPTYLVHISVAFFCANNKSISFPANWKTDTNIRYRTFSPDSNSSFNYQKWIVWLEQFKLDPNVTPYLAPEPGKEKEYTFFRSQFLEAYLYFVDISQTQRYSDHSFLAFLENLKVYFISFDTIKLASLQRAIWLGYLPGVDLKKLGLAKIDLNLILNLNPNTFNWDTVTPTQQQIIFQNRLYDDTHLAHPFNQPYEDIVMSFLQVTQEKDFFSTLKMILNNDLGIKLLFFNNEEYSLENLISAANSSDIRLQEAFAESKIWLLDTPSLLELVKIIFGNKRSLKKGVANVSQLKKHFESTKVWFLEREQATKRRNLAIGLGTAGGIVVLVGASGFAYWFVKIRKS